MAIKPLQILRRQFRLYCGPRIQGLWRFSREKTRYPSVALDEVFPPNHPLAQKKAAFHLMPPREIRSFVRHAIRLGETTIDPERLTNHIRIEEPHHPVYRREVPCEAHERHIRPWDDEPVGDRFSLRNKTRVPLRIVVQTKSHDKFLAYQEEVADNISVQPASEDQITLARRWDALPERRKKKMLQTLFSRLNKNLRYLSGGQFSLKLASIEFIDEEIDPYTELEDNGGFTMHVSYMDAGMLGFHHGHGIFSIAPDSLFLCEQYLYTGLAIHEMMHAFLGESHSFKLAGMNVFKWTDTEDIGLHEEEAAFLGWPHRKPVSSLTKHTL